ncbi:hypothetical protein Ferp_2455 [Ferroglobus placidus DSM 10642]|uniref:Uncharacterized protein n=1 Tax=Ferroglobus placidus (strain DSM 10642 / AEDII12DO) TaxID=589924 RepID=D3S272_FERPA|nr:hypothetical protein [Ferroglobus placidus]ADC66563.1 hypothetical protein Ferp_2455 [Ferroglobus placidus DSM 10642]
MRNFSEKEIEEVKFMLSHLKTIDDKTDIIIKASNGVLTLIVGIVAFMIAFASEKITAYDVILVSVPISLVLVSMVSSLLLLYPKFTQLVFFEREDFQTIERRYYLSLKKKNFWMKISVFSLVLGILSFILWFMYVVLQ